MDSERKVGKGESFEATATNAVITNSLGNITCEHSAMTMELTENDVSVVPGSVTALSFAKCKMSGGSECTFTAKNLPYSLSLTETLAVEDEVGVGGQVVCGISCLFVTKNATFTVENDQFIATKVEFSGSGFLCPKTATLDATYSLPTLFTVEY